MEVPNDRNNPYEDHHNTIDSTAHTLFTSGKARQASEKKEARVIDPHGGNGVYKRVSTAPAPHIGASDAFQPLMNKKPGQNIGAS